MQVLHKRINWMARWANKPVLEVHVDRWPRLHEFRHQRVRLEDGNDIYWAELDGAVHFLYHEKKDETGYGGATFSLTLEDGSVVDVHGPWSSNSRAMNLFFLPSHEATIFEGANTGGVAGALAAGLFIRLVREAGGEVTVVENYGSDEELPEDERRVILALAENNAPLGCRVALAIKLPGVTLAESQKMKRRLFA